MLLESARVALEAAIEEGEVCEAMDEVPCYDVKKMKLLLKNSLKLAQSVSQDNSAKSGFS